MSPNKPNKQDSKLLADFSTTELVQELKHREGVKEVLVQPHDGYTILAGLNIIENTGPAVLLIVID